MNSEFLMTPIQKAEDADQQFGTASIYARAMHILAKLVGENPTLEKVEEALPLVERWVEYKMGAKHRS